MRKLVYIETTIPSFYYETRSTPDMMARKEWTRQWWDGQRGNYSLVTSVVVTEELQQGHHPMKEDALVLMRDIPVLSIEPETAAVVDTYISHRLMPGDVRGDALHLAVASLHGCHYLLTWNCAHLANANKIEHIRHVNNMLGLYVPIMTTPVELLM